MCKCIDKELIQSDGTHKVRGQYLKGLGALQERRSYRLEFSRQEFILIVEAKTLFEQRNLKLVTLNALTKGLVLAHGLYRQAGPDFEAIETVNLIEEQLIGEGVSASLIPTSMTLFGADVGGFADVKALISEQLGEAYSIKATLVYLAAAYINQFEARS